MITAETHYLDIAAAYVRGAVADARCLDDAGAVQLAAARGLSLARYKQNAQLPRVRAAIGILKGLAPNDLLDVGSGRGTFLWPLLTAFPWVPVTSVEASEVRREQISAVAEGGLDRLTAESGDVRALSFGSGSFDGTTILEVLEHLHEPERAASEALRVSRRFVVASVPSKPDNNPEHVQLFTPETLSQLFLAAGARTVKIEHVHNHMLCLALKREPEGR